MIRKRPIGVHHSLALTLVFVTFDLTPCLADAIDGDWCRGPASFHIQGPQIRTPSGMDLTGSYARHTFHYLAPQGDADAGTEFFMRLMNEETVLLVRHKDNKDGPVETWMRCKPVS